MRRVTRLLINERLREYMQRHKLHTYSAAYPDLRRLQLRLYAGESEAESDSDEADNAQQVDGEQPIAGERKEERRGVTRGRPARNPPPTVARARG